MVTQTLAAARYELPNGYPTHPCIVILTSHTAGMRVMPADLAITVIGPDRNGIVSELSQIVASHNANWLDSHMAILAGQFAGIVHVSAPQDVVSELKAELLELQQSNLHITVTDGSSTTGPVDRRLVQLELTGLDHSGIVRDITQALLDIGVSIVEFESEQSDGSMSGEKMFRATASLDVPTALAIDALDEAMQGVSDSLMTDILLSDA